MPGPAHRLILLAAAFVASLALPAAASAGTLTYSGGVLSYAAAPGEANDAALYADDDPTKVQFGDDVAVVLGVGAVGVCAPHEWDTTIVCPRPAAFVATLGDGDDGFTVVDLDDVLAVPVDVDGGPGADDLGGGIAGDTLRGGADADQLKGFQGSDTLLGGDGNDGLSGYQGNDVLDGGAGDDSLEDHLIGENVHQGADTYIGGPGDDDMTYFMRFDPIAVALDGVANDGGAGEGDNLGSDVETIGGGQGDDTLVGDGQANHLYGSGGVDHLVGGGGNDRLDGNSNSDLLEGGPGADRLEGGCEDDVLDGGSGPDELLADHGCSDVFSRGTNDLIEARDGERDLVFCSGPGGVGDRALVDAIDNATTSGPGACRTLEVAVTSGSGAPTTGTPTTGAPAPGTPTTGGGSTGGGPATATPLVGKTRATLGPVRLLVGTGKAGHAVAQRVDLRAKKPRLVVGSLVASRAAKVSAFATMARKGRRRVTLGRRSMTVAAGKPRTLALPLSKTARRIVRSRKRVSARVTITVKEAGKRTVKKTLTVRAPVRKKK